MSSSSSGGESNWAWLGLLKWSLAYTDGTKPSDESMKAMSAEDRAFLEEVMKNGIIDEGERMKFILSELVSYLESVKDAYENDNNECGDNDDREEEIRDLLEELRDIVEQIDYAKAFASMGGIQFLLGCASSEARGVPRSIRAECMGVVATMCQNNPSVQYSLLELGHIPTLCDLYLTADSNSNSDSDGMFRSKVMQALSCSIRNHAGAETIFCINQHARQTVASGLGMQPSSTTTLALRKRSLFFLRALLTSDAADAQRIRLFATHVRYVASTFLQLSNNGTTAHDDNDVDENDTCVDEELCEMTLNLLLEMLHQKKSVNAILEVKNMVVSIGIPRVATLRSIVQKESAEDDAADDEEYEKETAKIHLDLWERLIVDIARARADDDDDDQQTGDDANQTLLIEGRPANDNGETMPQ